MMHPLRTHYDKWLLGVAALLLAGGVFWTFENEGSLRRVGAESTRVSLAGVAYVPVSEAGLDRPAAVWKSPGAERPVDLFTGSGLAAERGAPVMAEERSGPAVGEVPVLLAVKPEPYRFQLIGYLGHAGAYKALFSSQGSAETLLAEAGLRLGDSGMVLQSFSVRPLAVGENEAGPVHEAVAQAVLRDELTGAELTLDSRGPCLTGRWLAVLQPAPARGAPREVGEGDLLVLDDVVYRVQRIRPDPAEIVLQRDGSLGGAKTLRLAPGPGESAEPPQLAASSD